MITFSARMTRRAVLSAAFASAASAVVVGCGPAAPKSGETVKPDPLSEKRQSEMEEFYKKNPAGKNPAKTKK